MFEAEQKRESLRLTLHEMAVWNIHDPKVINGVIGTVDREGRPIPPKKERHRSIADFVRVSASKAHWTERRAGSVPMLREEEEMEED